MIAAESLAEIANGAIDRGAIQKGSELATLLFLASVEPPRTILEIGSAAGGTLFAWRSTWPEARVLSVDLPEGKFGYTDRAKHPLTEHGSEVILGDSHKPETLELVKALLGETPVDLLFIDGDHTLQGVTDDFLMYGPLVKPGGMIAFHDIAEHTGMPDVAVSTFWRDLEWPGWRFEQIDEPRNWGGIGILRVPDGGFPEAVAERAVSTIAVLTPTGQSFSPLYVSRHYQVVQRMRRGTVPYVQLAMGPYIAQNLRDAVRQLLELPGWRRLVIYENDMLPEPDTLARHARHTEPIVGSAYFEHSPPYAIYAYTEELSETGFPYMRHLSDEETEAIVDVHPGTHQVDAVGFGLTSIAREVLERWPKYRPLFHTSWDPLSKDTPGLAGEMGQDILFCREAREMGWSVWIDTTICCNHMSVVAVGKDTWHSNFQRRKAEAAAAAAAEVAATEGRRRQREAAELQQQIELHRIERAVPTRRHERASS